MANGFAHLHCHTHYSLLDGASRIPELMDRVKKLGMNACALTDHGNVYGAVEFCMAGKAAGINPIPGCEFYIAPKGRKHREGTKKKKGEEEDHNKSNDYYHLTVLAKNNAGFRNIIKLSSLGFTEGFYRKPRIDKEILEAHKEGLVVLSGCAAGELSRLLLAEKQTEARELIEWYTRVFGSDFYMEIQNNGMRIQRACADVTIDLANKMGIPLVATSDAHYLTKEDANVHDLLLCINTGKRRTDTDRMIYGDDDKIMIPEFYVCGPEQMYDRFPRHWEAVKRSQEIADQCHVEIDTKSRHFPTFTPPLQKTPEEYLRELCEKGLIERYGNPPPADAVARLEHELTTVCRMGFASYFLIVWDFVRFAQEKGIPYGARGSACGAIISYCLKLAHIEPLANSLLFERFLDPNRAEAPDIDIDFCQNRREEVLAYVREKYGADCVAQIGTFGTLAAKMAVRDVGRALDIPLEDVGRITKLIPDKLTLEEALANEGAFSGELEAEWRKNPRVKEMLDFAIKLEGTNKSAGTHAAGVVITPGPVTDYIPVHLIVRKTEGEKDKERVLTTQWAMGDVEKVGILKMDFLGLRTYTVLDMAVKNIKQTHGIDINYFRLPLDDRKTYDLLQSGETRGVFQFECVAGETILNGGPSKTISELYANPPARMISIDFANGKRVSNRVLRIVSCGKKQLYRLTTPSGYMLRAGGEHDVLTSKGWKRLIDLKPGDLIAVNRKDASRIGCCTNCEVNTKSRHRCNACANHARGSVQTMCSRRDDSKWLKSLLRGPKNPSWGRKPLPAKLYIDGVPHPVRSHWEADFALLLMAKGVEYQYEPRTFVLKNGSSYTPDFYLPEKDIWVELRGKGGLSGTKKKKYDRFRKEFPEIKIIIIRAQQIAEFELRNPELQPWNCPCLPVGFDLEPVRSVTKDAVEDTYDVVMESPFNNYIANGIVVHNSDGIRELLRRVKPDRLDDITAATALYRPGPLGGGMVDEFIECKHGRKKPTYLHPVMEEVLSPTYGVMCIHKDTRVSFADGTERPISSVKIGDMVHSLSNDSREFDIKECHGCGPTRIEDGFQLQIENGSSVILTGDHPVRVFGGTYKRVDELDPAKDLVAAAVKVPVSEATQKIPTWLGSETDTAYLVGYLVGNGALTGTSVTLCVGSKASAKKMAAWLRAKFPKLNQNIYFHTRSWYIGISSEELLNSSEYGNRKTVIHHMVEQLGLKCIAQEKRIPAIIFGCTREVKHAFFAGLIDSDGHSGVTNRGWCILHYTSASTALLDDIQQLCRHLGYIATRRKVRIHFYSHEQIRNEISRYMVIRKIVGKLLDGKTIGWVPRTVIKHRLRGSCAFAKRSTAKQSGVDCSDDVRYYRITSINRVKKQQFYGMSVADNHNLVANGIVVKNCYQEQVMQILNRLGGIELAKAYATIKAISKKKQDIINQRETEFVSGAVANGLKQDDAEKIFSMICEFGGYGFNKSHSASYALVSFQTAYLKTHYPVEFMAALLTTEGGESSRKEELVGHIEDARKMNIQISSPDVAVSEAAFTIHGRNICCGLMACQGVSEETANVIVEARKSQPFRDFPDFIARTQLNKTILESLIKVGACESFGNRGTLLANYEKYLKGNRAEKKKYQPGQMDFFTSGYIEDDGVARMEEKPDWTKTAKLGAEKELLGFYLSGHPLQEEKDAIHFAKHQIADLKKVGNKQATLLAGMISQVRIQMGKNNRQYARFKLEDLTGMIEGVVWSDQLDMAKSMLTEGNVCLVHAKVDHTREEPSIQAVKFVRPSEVVKELAKALVVEVDLKADETLVDTIRVAIQNSPGKLPVYLAFTDEAGRQMVMRAGEKFSVSAQGADLGRLANIAGVRNVQWV